jgi:separase
MYCEALQLSESGVAEEKAMSTSDRIRARVGRLERAAIASHVFAVIQYWRVRSFIRTFTQSQ